MNTIVGLLAFVALPAYLIIPAMPDFINDLSAFTDDGTAEQERVDAAHAQFLAQQEQADRDAAARRKQTHAQRGCDQNGYQIYKLMMDFMSEEYRENYVPLQHKQATPSFGNALAHTRSIITGGTACTDQYIRQQFYLYGGWRTPVGGGDSSGSGKSVYVRPHWRSAPGTANK
jgi:hypothetical protein